MLQIPGILRAQDVANFWAHLYVGSKLCILLMTHPLTIEALFQLLFLSYILSYFQTRRVPRINRLGTNLLQMYVSLHS